MLVIMTVARGQGQFVFNAKDSDAANILKFTLAGNFATGPDFFVQVFAGPNLSHLAPLDPLLALNGAGADAGFPNPSNQVYEVPGLPAGSQALVGYVGFKGASLATATIRGFLKLGEVPVTLTEPPTNPNEVKVGVVFVPIDIPEPGALILSLMGLSPVLLLLGKRKGAG
jgi:hypothetical protein